MLMYYKIVNLNTFLAEIATNTGCLPKKLEKFVDHKTKGFCSIIKFSFDFN